MVRREAAGPPDQTVPASTPTCSVESATISTATKEMPAATNAVIKVHYKDEVLRFRVGWPLDLSKLRSDVFTTLQTPGPAGRRLSGGEEVSPATSSSSSPMLLYHGSKGKLLELSDTSLRDFSYRHDPAQPIRLRAVMRSPESLSSCAREQEAIEAVAEQPREGPGSSDGDGFGVVNADPSEEATACKEAKESESEIRDHTLKEAEAEIRDQTVNDSCLVADQGSGVGLPSSPVDQAAGVSESFSVVQGSQQELQHPPQTVEEFIGGYSAEHMQAQSMLASKQPAEKNSILGPGKNGISLPIAAQTAAYALSDVFENARERLSEALSIPDKSTRPSQNSADLQRALRESEDLQRAIQASAAESRKRLAKVLDLYQLRLRPVAADGNCQFRALSVQLCGDETKHTALRQLVTKQLHDRRDRYEGYMLGSYEEYVEHMARDGEWGDNVTLQAASDILKCEIHVLTDQPGSELLELKPEAKDEEGKEAPQRQALCLAFLTEVHYDAVVMEAA